MECSKCDLEMVLTSPRGPRFIGPFFKTALVVCNKCGSVVEVLYCPVHPEPMDQERGSRRQHNIRSCRISSCPRGWEIPEHHSEYIRPQPMRFQAGG